MQVHPRQTGHMQELMEPMERTAMMEQQVPSQGIQGVTGANGIDGTNGVDAVALQGIGS